MLAPNSVNPTSVNSVLSHKDDEDDLTYEEMCKTMDAMAEAQSQDENLFAMQEKYGLYQYAMTRRFPDRLPR